MGTNTLPFVRFTRQVATSPMAILAVPAAALQAEAALKVAPWSEVATQQSTFPARNALQTGFADTWDAFKHCGDYSAGNQVAYAGMAAYRFRVPADGLTTPDHVVSLSIPLYVDRWLVDGVRISAYVSASPTPSTDWDVLRTGTGGTAYEDDLLPMTYTGDPPVRVVVEKNDTIVVTLPASTDALAYIWVIVSLEDYATTRGFWIEGAALILGGSATCTFDATVTDDTPWDGNVPAAAFAGYWGGAAMTYVDNAISILKTHASIPLAQNLAVFPTDGVTTNAFYAGSTGATIGVDTGGKVTGSLMIRYIGMGTADTYDALWFDTDTLLPLAGKTVNFRMVIWAASTSLLATVFVKADVTGLLQSELYRGYGTPSLVTQLQTSSAAATDQAAWTLAKIGEVTLSGIDYTAAHRFPITLTGGGRKALIIAVMPIHYWGTVGTDTKAVFKPGAQIYLR